MIVVTADGPKLNPDGPRLASQTATAGLQAILKSHIGYLSFSIPIVLNSDRRVMVKAYSREGHFMPF
jgi:hypothetical protein